MKCSKGHTKEEMDKKGLEKLPYILWNHVKEQWFIYCPIDGSDVLVELKDFTYV